jgi:pimeloyl-ACP methyl ester carboxylesterase
VHGSYHAAWCWADHWLPFFAARGHDCYAVSLRCQGGSGGEARGGVAGTLASHAADVTSLAAVLPSSPVLIGHSFGGLVVQEALSARSPSPPPVAGVVLLCSVPPSGNSAMVRLALLRCRPR